MLSIFKKLLPVKWKEKMRSCLYFNGIYKSSPKVFRVVKEGKTLFLSNMIDITHWSKVNIGDNVFIWHFTILDSFNGITIGDDCQIGTRVGIFTHSSHNSIRYYNKSYHDVFFDNHVGRVKGPVKIGKACFIGANSIIMPNTTIGNGCIVAAYSYVQGVFDDYSIIAGNPAKKIGDVRKMDHRHLKKYPELYNEYLKYFEG